MSIPHATFQDIVDVCDRLAQKGRRLRPGKSQIAAFDGDGTLWGPDVADLLWRRLVAHRALHRRGAAPIARALRACGAAPAHDAYRDYGRLADLHQAGGCSEETMVRVMLQGLAGMREEEIVRHCEQAVRSSHDLAGAASGTAAQLAGRLRAQGFRVLVVSGSPRWIVEAAVRPLDIEPRDVIAGRVAVQEGVLTDGIIEPLPHGQGKIQAILRHCGAVPHVSVGNGLGDLAMLEAASHLKLLVNPTGELLRACEEEGGAAWSMGILKLPAPPAGGASPKPGARSAKGKMGAAGAPRRRARRRPDPPS